MKKILHSNILIIGEEKSGKTGLIKKLLKNNQNVEKVFVISSKKEFDNVVYIDFDDTDDYMNDNESILIVEITNDEDISRINYILCSYRKTNTIIISIEKPYPSISKKTNSMFDYIFLVGDIKHRPEEEIEEIYKQYGFIFYPEIKQFREIIEKKEHKCDALLIRRTE